MDAETLRETERECIAKIRRKADKLMAQDAALSRSIAMAKACELLPKTMNSYLAARSRLQFMGVPALPLR